MEKNNKKNNDRRKRKMVENNNSSNNNEDDEDVHKQQELQEENEEEKMEQFFALIRNTKDMRDRLKQHQVENKKQLEKEEEEENHHLLQKGSGFNNINNYNNVGAQTWNPTFQVEDFMDDIAKSSNSNIYINTSQDATQELLPGSSSKSQDAEVAEAEAEAAREGGNTNDHLDLKLSL